MNETNASECVGVFISTVALTQVVTFLPVTNTGAGGGGGSASHPERLSD